MDRRWKSIPSRVRCTRQISWCSASVCGPTPRWRKQAGLEIGELGGIRTDEQMRTSEPDIFAAGDAVEVRDFVTGEWSLVALAGPANRQGRIAADVIAGRDSRFRGTQGTAIIGLFEGTAAWTGVSEKTLKRIGDEDYEKIYLYPNSHAGYYPGAKPIAMKVLFRKSDGACSARRRWARTAWTSAVSALAALIQMGATVYDLEESELCYAPQFGSAKDPVNFSGMVAAERAQGRHADRPLARNGRRLPSSTCANRSSLPWRTSRAPSTFPSGSCGTGWTNCRATRRFTSSAARGSVPTMRRACCSRTDST